ncbi:hypothetical protein [Pseudobdellovibrio exovorus]|uniref:Uncharacterized protein n=1 Tax=Pseudobdellovibrio exovorus JSS TaxID=1184267 RepID=M4V6T7_9BACT|nr:hypothetical protein [Pseudobdellovibrio exovorus]AGH95082.1 hypothetical protein A11Q_864 [Pseudobdellovibrio exovorus JSS]
MKTQFFLAALLAGQLAFAQAQTQTPEPNSVVASSEVSWEVDPTAWDSFDLSQIPNNRGDVVFVQAPQNSRLNLSLPEEFVPVTFGENAAPEEEVIENPNLFRFSNNQDGLQGAIRSLRNNVNSGLGFSGYRIRIRRMERFEDVSRFAPGIKKPSRPYMVEFVKKF